jgi:hypothetical protein
MQSRLLISFLVAATLLHAIMFWRARRELKAGYQDFTIFYTAGKILSRGQGKQLYNFDLQHRTQQEFASRVDARQGPLGPYNHIPAEALLFVPLVRLPYFSAYLLWVLLNFAALLGALSILRAHVPRLPLGSLVFRGVLGLSFFPVFLCLLQGQDVLLQLLLLTLAYSALARRSPVVAGCWFGLAIFRFPVVLPLVFILATQKKWRLLAGFASATSVVGLLSATAVGWKQTLLYPYFVLTVEKTSVGPMTSSAMPNLRGLIETAMPNGSESWVFSVLVLCFSLALLFLTCKRANLDPASGEFDLSFSLAIVAAVLVSYHAYTHDLSILLIPVLLVANYCLTHRSRVRALLVGPIFVFFLVPLYALLVFRLDLACLLAVPLLVWFWGIAWEVSNRRQWKAETCQPI